MSVAITAPPTRFKIHRAPLLDPPFDDEIVPDVYCPRSRAPVSSEPVDSVSAACHTAALRFLNICLELFNGFRSPGQMWPLLHVEHALEVIDELTKTTRHLSEVRRRHIDARIHRRGLRTCEPRAGVAEVAAVLNDTQRTWAMCYRLERQRSVWQCTHLRAMLPPARAGTTTIVATAATPVARRTPPLAASRSSAR